VATGPAEHGFLLPPDSPRCSLLRPRAAPSSWPPLQRRGRCGSSHCHRRRHAPSNLTIPTPNPWLPLRILGLGQAPDAVDPSRLFLLTERATLRSSPLATTPVRARPVGERVGIADSPTCGADKGMGGMPAVDVAQPLQDRSPARELKYDLAVDASASRLTPGRGTACGPAAAVVSKTSIDGFLVATLFVGPASC